ncbi:hypothetical protein EV668_4670 [Enterovirga rhinocerotis]|uniref:Uncharacterized protein n=1 Tax=Enterovirga rhinocerotis TaxID=1339210 RepID=A0A4R7BIR8_9HYPH|nr:hypothetical protein EV668_4670 [Enterovirga rhinocerotis]
MALLQTCGNDPKHPRLAREAEARMRCAVAQRPSPEGRALCQSVASWKAQPMRRAVASS